MDEFDGQKHYSHDLRKEKEVFSKRQLGGGSVMSWRNFACIDMGSILFVSGKINSQSYQRILKSHLLPNAGFLAGENLKFQPGNAPVHMSNGTKLWFLVNSVETWK